MERTRVDEQRGREEEGLSGREKERKREKPSRELDGSRATIRRGDFTERGSCWSPRRRHKRGQRQTVEGRKRQKREEYTHTEKEKERQKKKQDTGSGLQRNNINMRDRQTEKKDQTKNSSEWLEELKAPVFRYLKLQIKSSQTKLKMHQAMFYTYNRTFDTLIQIIAKLITADKFTWIGN